MICLERSARILKVSKIVTTSALLESLISTPLENMQRISPLGIMQNPSNACWFHITSYYVYVKLQYTVGYGFKCF